MHQGTMNTANGNQLVVILQIIDNNVTVLDSFSGYGPRPIIQ